MTKERRNKATESELAANCTVNAIPFPSRITSHESFCLLLFYVVLVHFTHHSKDLGYLVSVTATRRMT